MKKLRNWFQKIFYFYYDGFSSMTWGRQLWAIILLKLFIMFVILKIFFFPNLLKKDFANDKERSKHVIEQLTSPKK